MQKVLGILLILAGQACYAIDSTSLTYPDIRVLTPKIAVTDTCIQKQGLIPAVADKDKLKLICQEAGNDYVMVGFSQDTVGSSFTAKCCKVNITYTPN